MTTKQFAALAGAAVLGAIIGTAALTTAAGKTITLTAPDMTQVREIQMKYVQSYTTPTGTVVADAVRVTINACALDTANPDARDCGEVIMLVPTTNPLAVNVYTAAINAWKTAKGY